MEFLDANNKKKKEKTDIDFGKLQIPMIRRTFPELITNQIVGVQPMSAPVGAAFALRYKYEDIPEGIAKEGDIYSCDIVCVNCHKKCSVTSFYYKEIILKRYNEDAFCPYCYKEWTKLNDELAKEQGTQTSCVTASSNWTDSLCISGVMDYTPSTFTDSFWFGK